MGRLLHGLTERFGIMDDGFELGVGQDPQQVVQNEKELGCQDVAVLYLEQTRKNSTCRQQQALFFVNVGKVKIRN